MPAVYHGRPAGRGGGAKKQQVLEKNGRAAGTAAAPSLRWTQ